MKTRTLLLSALAALPVLCRAQGAQSALETDFSTRTSIAVDKRLSKGLHLEAEYELRTENALSKIDRHQASLGLSYKFTDWLKGGLSYTFFDRYGATAGWEPRHRLSGSLTFGYRAGDWRFSLRGMAQLTHKTEDLNVWQETRNQVTLKSRFKVQYKGFSNLEPYGLLDLKTLLNDPLYSSGSFAGYTHAYITRYRGGLGLEWKFSPQHALNVYGLLDYNYTVDIDANRAGTMLKGVGTGRVLNTTLGVGYTFSF